MSDQPFTPEEERQRSIRARRTLTWLIVFAIVMFFAGLTSAYVVSKSGAAYWVRFPLPPEFMVSTALVLLGSLTMHLALTRARAGKGQVVPLALTLLLGIGFSVSQYRGWGTLLAQGQHLTKAKITQPTGEYGRDFTITHRGVTLERVDGSYYRPEDTARERPLDADMADQANTASQYFYAITWAHFGHMLFGLLSVGVMLVMAARGRYTPENQVGLWSGAVYWHFLAGLWIYLLSFLAWVH